MNLIEFLPAACGMVTQPVGRAVVFLGTFVTWQPPPPQGQPTENSGQFKFASMQSLEILI